MTYIKSNFRVKKHPRGWVAEYKKPRWSLFGIKYKWAHYISVSGISSMPWYFGSKEAAERELLLNVKWDMIRESVTSF